MIKEAYILGQFMACRHFSIKLADETDIQEQMEQNMGQQETDNTPADDLVRAIQQLELAAPTILDKIDRTEGNQISDRLNRQTVWGGLTSPDSGDTASRVTGFVLPDSSGKAY